MKHKVRKFNLRHAILLCCAEILLAVFCAIGIFYFWRFIQEQRVHLQEIQSVSTATEAQRQQTVMKVSLGKYQTTIQQIKDLIPAKITTGDVVSRMEQEVAATPDIRFAVTDIYEEIHYDKNHQPIKQVGPYVDVRFTIEAAGPDPMALLQLLYRLEYLPYVTQIISWDVRTVTARELPLFVQPASRLVPSSVQATPSPAPTVPGTLNELRTSLLITMTQ